VARRRRCCLLPLHDQHIDLVYDFFTLDGSRDYSAISNDTFTVCNQHEFHDLATLPIQVLV
jgi:hypothetical protein